MTYEYACTACGHEWEAEQSIREEPLKKCPKCGKNHAKRQISKGAGFILKGGGWYADGYGSSKSGGSSDGGGSSEASKTESSSSSSSSSSETKSEPKKPEKKSSKGKTVAA